MQTIPLKRNLGGFSPVQSETPWGPSKATEEPEEREEENNSIPLSRFLGQGLIDFLISRPST